MKSVTDFFSKKGLLSEHILGFQYRAEQEDMAKSISLALKKEEDLICEAGTGTGKTMAYLIPALLSGKKTIISTGTKHLQDQLNQKDLPVILDLLSTSVKSVVLKGRANYLCLQRMENARQNPDKQKPEESSDLQEIYAWSSYSKTGDINELSKIAENSSIRTIVTSTTENCLGQSCPKFQNCFIFENRKKAMEADLIITNHHLLLSDMSLREGGFGEVLPLAEVIIFDEAHQLPELASIYFSQSISSRQLLELITDVRVADRQEAGDIPQLNAILATLEKRITDIRLLFRQINNRVNWHKIEEETTLGKEVLETLPILQELLDILELVCKRGKLLDNCFQRTKNIYDDIESYIKTNNDETIRWVETKNHHFYLNQTPVSVAKIFRYRLRHYDATHIFTSASLAINNDFDHFVSQLGLKDCACSVWNSPFDYKSQTYLYIPIDIPDVNKTTFFDVFIKTTVKLINYSQGRAFVLFTSHKLLNKAASLLNKSLNYPLFIQGKAPRSEILNQFRNTKNSVLLGTSSFWEGVDVKGEALSLVIIDKIPFASPDDPVLQTRLAYLAKKGGNPFMDYQLPQAAIILKQGVGRLIRDVKDKGVCVICDSRIINKSYGKKILNALPEMPVTHNILDIEKFYLRNR